MDETLATSPPAPYDWPHTSQNRDCPTVSSPIDCKTAIVTGSGSGLGRALALRLAHDGWHIAVADINEPGAQETLALILAAGGAGQVELLDVTDPAAWKSLIERLDKTWPQLDLLVNNAGVCCAGEVGELPLSDWQWIVNVNLMGAIYGSHACVEWLKRNPRGAHLVNVSSLASVAGMPSMAAYNVTKAGVLALSETLYAELRPHGVGVTVVAPGFFQTRLLETGRFMHATQRESAERLTQRARITADTLSEQIVRAASRRRLYVVAPLAARVIWRLKRYFPRLFLRLVSFAYHREMKRLR